MALLIMMVIFAVTTLVTSIIISVEAWKKGRQIGKISVMLYWITQFGYSVITLTLNM